MAEAHLGGIRLETLDPVGPPIRALATKTASLPIWRGPEDLDGDLLMLIDDIGRVWEPVWETDEGGRVTWPSLRATTLPLRWIVEARQVHRCGGLGPKTLIQPTGMHRLLAPGRAVDRQAIA
ncbi:MAG: hypothetical protein AAGN46_05560 [Acidobacteriota bacterium]